MDDGIFTICHQCGKLLYIPQNTWKLLAQSSESEEKNNDASPKTSFQPPSHLKRSCDVTIDYNINSSQSIKRFEKISKMLTHDNKNPFFPLCQDCTVTYIQHIQNYKKLFDAANDLIDKKFSDIPKNVFNIQYQNAISPATNFVNSKSNVDNNKITIIENDELNSRKNSYIDEICQDPFNCNHPSHKNCPMLIDLSNRSKPFCPLLSCFVFKIGYYHHYATINNLRVGFYKYDPNTISETNFALYFITHLLYILKTAFNANGIRILLSPYPSISINNEEFQKLVIPEKKKHANYDEINFAMQSLFVAFNIINESSFPHRKIATPYEVDTDLRTIGSVNYDFNWKTVEDWSLAMRFLLHNLKMVQFRAIRSCFYPKG